MAGEIAFSIAILPETNVQRGGEREHLSFYCRSIVSGHGNKSNPERGIKIQNAILILEQQGNIPAKVTHLVVIPMTVVRFSRNVP
jgi:hypothetical protein